jgi:branched-chain amino acid transport system permease protein
MYILVALGFAFLFGMLGILNLAHGAIYMVAGYIAYDLIKEFGINQWIGVLLTTLILAGFGAFLEKYCFRPFTGDFNRTVMVTVAITVILQTTINIMAGTKVLSLPPFAKGNFSLGSLSISNERLLTFGIGAALLLVSVWFVKRTKWGLQMQAIAQNAKGAFLQGIDVHHISALACAAGCGLAAVAGCLLGAFLGIGPFVGDVMLVKVLMLVILAGAGSLGGIFLTGSILGCLDAILPILTTGANGEALTVIVVIVLLLIRPQGFFGHEF